MQAKTLPKILTPFRGTDLMRAPFSFYLSGFYVSKKIKNVFFKQMNNAKKGWFMRTSSKMPRMLLATALVFSAFGCASDKYKKEIDGLKGQVNNLEKSNHDKNSELSKYQSQLATSSQEKTQLRTSLEEMNKREEAQRREFEDLQARLKSLSDAGTLSVKMMDGKLVVNMGSDILFPSGSAKLSKEGLQTIIEVAKQLKTIPDKKFQVEGHTDNVPIATAIFPSNWELASARAVMVVKTMIREGFSPNHISAASFAEFAPIQTNDTKEGKAANRRIAIVIVPDLSVVPGLKDVGRVPANKTIAAPKPVSVQQLAAPAVKSSVTPMPVPKNNALSQQLKVLPQATVQSSVQPAMPSAAPTLNQAKLDASAETVETKKPAVPQAEKSNSTDDELE